MPEWTKEQKSAIEDRGGTLLVSAAAGSGKTAVLTERVLRRVTDPENPIDITELLLVTFTRAAAAEMRERIAAAIGAAVAQDPSSVRLRRQLFLVHRAKITTVHALCMSLAREQAAALGIAPDFRLMDENESKILRAEVLEEVLETAYERADEKFLALSDLLTARGTMYAQELTVEQARKAYKISDTRYRAGAGTILELNSAQLSQTQAQLNFSQAIYDYLSAKAEYDRIVGREHGNK